MYNAYQQTQGEAAEKAMQRASHVASFIGHQPGKALFTGLYSIGASKPLTFEEYWRVPQYVEMKKFGMKGFLGDRPSVLWFDLVLTDFYASWKGKLIVEWPPPERSWWRRAHRNTMPVLAVLEESALFSVMPAWDELALKWEELRDLPASWEPALKEWRGIYYIFDTSDGKSYVGSAYGKSNLWGRWKEYAASGHGGNSLLRKRDPVHFRFTILQRVSPDMEAEDVIQLENKGRIGSTQVIRTDSTKTDCSTSTR
ncbi:MAG: GIY-YIG nuclease family protein [Candidatus Solibacter usitatus]|nr:GIY-YIG nuclease family protein [Candidatus Solibacter usitatus]